MSHEELTAALTSLRQELANSGDLDGEDMTHLRDTLNEIQGVLDQDAGATETLTGRVTHSAKRFEESHPILTESLGRIADILQQMGI